MCGRYARFTPAELYARLFEAEAGPELAPSYNVAPSQPCLVARVDGGGRRVLSSITWGLLPFWARERRTAYSTINARAETVAAKPSFREPFRRRRCLVAADAFYEWQAAREGRPKQPYAIRRRDGSPFAMAGIWDSWRREGMVLETFAIIVTTPNEALRPVHDRMPVILDPADYAVWLAPAVQDPTLLTPLLRPCPAAPLEVYPVGLDVNDPSNDNPGLLERVSTAPVV